MPPDTEAVVVSDMVTPAGGAGPLADYAGGGSATEWRTVLSEILKLDFDAAIPGNGPVMTKAEIQAYATKYNQFLDRALELVRKGTPKDQLVAQIKTDDLGFTPRIPNVDAFYEDLSKLK